MATTIPISTNTTIATCIQIHVGDIVQAAYPDAPARPATVEGTPRVVVHGGDQPAPGAAAVTMIRQWLDALEGRQDALLKRSSGSHWR
jgi:hypothetical protein